ncbi:MAG: NAD(P)/FAD-dependent oxidoreductase [Acidobacteriota bacterium]
MGNCDAIIIGAGHNGLVTAGYLAKAGRKVLVLERRNIVGGAAVTEEIFPGFKVSSVADGIGYLSPAVQRDLKLDSHVETIASDVVAFCPQPDGSHLTIYRDSTKTVQEITRISRADAEAYPGFIDLMQALAGVVGGLMHMTPLDLPEVGLADLRGAIGLIGPGRKLGRKRITELLRILSMPTADILNEYFESGAVKGAIGAHSVLGITWGPQEAGTAYTMLHSWALSGNGLFRSAGVVKGGMGALSDAIANAARGFGAEIRTDAPVANIVVEEGRATGVKLESGEELKASVIVSNADPRTTFTQLLDPRYLGAGFMKHVTNIKYRGSGLRIHLALSALPQFTAISGSDTAQLLRAPIQIAPSLDYIERAYDCSKYGRFSENPYLDILLPSLSDPSLAPDGQHLMSITAKYGPYKLREGSWDTQKEAFADVVVNTLADYAPNIRDIIQQRHVLSMPDLESIYGLPEGNPNHGEMTLDQFFHMRPIPGYAQYRAPVGGMYLCGAGCHPGGGVSGLPGHNAAREILKDLK